MNGDLKPPIYPMRLQKFLARCGVASRRGAENLMTAGRVRVNGALVTELGSKVKANTDTVTVDGHEVSLSDTAVYLVLNKPAGYLTTMRDPHGRPCVADLVPTDRYPGLYPVGRLDKDTTGILLFTTDGDIGNKLLHPKHHVEKTYVATIKGVPDEGELEKLRCGIELEDGLTQPARVQLLGFSKHAGSQVGTSTIELVITEGRKRQVKRMCSAIGHEVVALHRRCFGPVGLGELEVGKWRLLADEELAKLKDQV